MRDEGERERQRRKKKQELKINKPALHPVWAGWQAGLVPEASGLPVGLGRLVGRPPNREQRLSTRPRPVPRPGSEACELARTAAMNSGNGVSATVRESKGRRDATEEQGFVFEGVKKMKEIRADA